MIIKMIILISAINNSLHFFSIILNSMLWLQSNRQSLRYSMDRKCCFFFMLFSWLKAWCVNIELNYCDLDPGTCILRILKCPECGLANQILYFK